jgi:hypothetical protein
MVTRDWPGKPSWEKRGRAIQIQAGYRKNPPDEDTPEGVGLERVPALGLRTPAGPPRRRRVIFVLK